MDIAQSLIGNFPNTINKESQIFTTMIANSNKNGLFETLLKDASEYIKTWTDTPDIYKQNGQMFEMTAAFFSFLERYTDEPDDAFKKRIKTIFQRNGDVKWGNPYDVKKVFEAFFSSARIFLVENTNENIPENNFLKDGDFQNKSDKWIGINEDPTSNCFYSKEARFSKSFGVFLKNTGTFYQTVNFDNSYSSYTVGSGNTYETIANKFYGNSDLADVIKSYEDNPETISGPVNATTNVIFSRKVSKNELMIIPKGTIVACGNKKYITQEDGEIIADNTAIKASKTVIFSKTDKSDEDTEISSGTIVSNGTYRYITTKDGKILAGAINSDEIPIEAEDFGSDYNTGANTINTIVSSISIDITSVNNPYALENGYDGDNKSSKNILVKAQISGSDYNTGANTINTIESELTENISVTNSNAVINGYDGDVIKIPARKTMFLHFFLNGNCDVEIKDNNNRYWKPDHHYDHENHKWVNGSWTSENYRINFNTISDIGEKTKASCDVEFTVENPATEKIIIPKGTVVKSDNLKFITQYEAAIDINDTKSGPIEVLAENHGWEYNVPANSINTMETPIDEVSVNNEDAATGGSDSIYTKESMYFITDKEITSVTIKFIGKANCFIDYIRLFEKMPYPSFTIIAQFDTYSGVDAAALFPGKEDESVTEKHRNASYYDNDFFTGMTAGNFTADLYEELINYVRAVGVKAYVEIVNKDEGTIEEE